VFGRSASGLDRFVAAQDEVWEDVIDELSFGKKQSHWMWFVFPQLKGLGRSGTAIHFGLEGRAEAEAYFAHALLGPRLVQCTRLVLSHPDRAVHDIFGSPDDLKLRSCVTLFREVAPQRLAFDEILRIFYRGEADRATLDLLAAGA
jgi:uncharacterized protein (DUF1810 family)